MDLNMNNGGNHNGNQNVIMTSTSACEHPEHNPPVMAHSEMYFSHRCPACGYSLTFAVGRPAQT